MICWLLPTATPFKSYCQSPEHSEMPTTARNPNLFLLSLGTEFCPPKGPTPARSHILQGPVLNVNSKGKRKYTDDDDTEEDKVNPESKEDNEENEDKVKEDSEDAHTSDAFVAEDSSNGKLPRRKRKIIITEGDNDDSFVAVTAAPSGTPLFDLSTEDLLAMERSRIRKQTVLTVPDSPSKAMKPPPTKTKYSVKSDEKWWVNGGTGPIMPGYGETIPLYSKICGYVPSVTSFEEFAQGKRQMAKGKAHTWDMLPYFSSRSQTLPLH
jgi:mannose-6-phosphate isomerase-like protein (cupin superfamily)